MRRMTSAFIAVAGLAVAWGVLAPSGASATLGQPLTDSEMGMIRGSAGPGPCKSCHLNPGRFDECGHLPGSQPVCADWWCIQNEMVGSTCDLGEPHDCSGTLDAAQTQIIQYVRYDTNCTWSADYYHLWRTDYWDGQGCQNCLYRFWNVACDKTNGQCNGTLDHRELKGQRIVCN
jgi:hypothetical protein